MKVAIVTPGFMPIPAVLGGAVECLDEFLVKENEKSKQCSLVVYSVYHQTAQEKSSGYRHTAMKYVHVPSTVKFLDKAIYRFVKLVRPKCQVLSYRYILQRLYYINWVAKDLKKNDYDRVMLENHATNLLPMKLKGNLKKYDNRIIYHQHNDQKKLYGCENVILHARKVLTVSQFIADSIQTLVPGLKPSQMTVWKNCVNTDLFGTPKAYEASRGIREKLGIPEEEKIILFSGRVSPEKGVKELLTAFSRLEDKNVRLVIAGGYLGGDSSISSPYLDELKEIATQLGSRVIFTGFVPYNEVPAYYMMADIVVVPSIIKNDAAPLAVIEAITSGKPLITTESGGIPEYATKDCAIILKLDDALVDSLTDALMRLLKDDALRERMHRHALKTSEGWTTKKYYENFLEYIK